MITKREQRDLGTHDQKSFCPPLSDFFNAFLYFMQIDR
jgi:hypothetical protein